MNDLTAILLCGGKGERLRPFTDTLPKALVPLGDRPLLEHLLVYLSKAGIRRFVVCVGYQAEAIERFVREKSDPSWEITCVDSGETASITDRLCDAREHVRGRALVCYGDTLANVDLDALVRRHEEAGGLASLTVYPLHSPFGIVGFDGAGKVSEFAEKPILPYWINIGFLLCEPEALGYLERGLDVPDFLGSLAGDGRLFVHRHEGKHLTVNTEKERTSAEREVVEFYTLLDNQSL